MNEFNFKSLICTSREQSERLLALGLKKETADCVWIEMSKDDWRIDANGWKAYYSIIEEGIVPAWSLHRLIEILDTNPFVFYINCGYDTVIDYVEEYIRSGFIDTRYLEEWCLNEED